MGIFVALAGTPSARTHVEMFDAAEKEDLQRLAARAGPGAVAAWAPEEDK